jgi:2'-5' RNA ligase
MRVLVMRAFIAVEVSKDVLSEIDRRTSEWRDRLRGARWVPASNLHLTLRFLGETSEATLEELSETMTDIASRFSPFDLNFDGIGYFPSARRPRVFWVGVKDPLGVLAELQERIETAARKHGFEPEKRRFSPHLTLARFKGAKPHPDYELLTREYGNLSFGSSKVEEVILFKSVLRQEGAEYTALRRFRLGTL